MEISEHPRCVFLLTRGKNRGSACNAKCSSHPTHCRLHERRAPPQAQDTKLTDLPVDILQIILANFAEHYDVKLLAKLSATCKYMNDQIDHNSSTIWQTAWNALARDYPELSTIKSPSSPKGRLKLHWMTGCQFCKAPRIRKVYREFNVRCCKSCLYARTISDYQLEKVHLVNLSRLKSLPFTSADLWSRSAGSYRLNFYWTDSVVQILGRSLKEHQAIEQERREKEARAMAEKKMSEFVLQLEEYMNTQQTLPFDMTYLQKDIDKYYRHYKPKDLVSDALKRWNQEQNQKQLNTYLKQHTRAQKTTLTELKRTDTYKNCVSQARTQFSENDWAKVRLERFHLGMKKYIQNDMHIRSVYDIAGDPQYVEWMKNASLPTQQEWDVFSANRHEKTELLRRLKSAKSGQSACPYCVNMKREFSQQGLQNHVEAVHIRRNFWPSSAPDPIDP
jgi:hypothetical protein